jgi:hypothetical protein
MAEIKQFIVLLLLLLLLAVIEKAVDCLQYGLYKENP